MKIPKSMLHQRVNIETLKGSKYAGCLCKIENHKDRICLSHLNIINKKGGVTCSGVSESRWFKISNLVKIVCNAEMITKY